MLIVVKALHMLALLALLWASLRKNMLLSAGQITGQNALRARRFDILSAAAAGVMLLTGVTMVLGFAKPAAYYFYRPAFWAKMVIFLVASGLIIWTKGFIRKAATCDTLPVPGAVRWILHGDFVGLLVMIVLGIVIAHGL